MSIRLPLLFLIFFTCLLAGCSRKIDMQYLETLVRMEHPKYKNQPVPDDILQETKAIVKKYRDDLANYGKKVEKLADLYKNMAQRYLDIGYFQRLIPVYIDQIEKEENIPGKKEDQVYDQALGLLLQQKGLYAKAYEYFSKALEISLDSSLLYYYCGLCTANIAKAEKIAGTPQADEWFGKAEKYYKRAIEIDPDYIEALYGLSVVYVYELGRPAEALPYLLRIKGKQPDNIENLFLLATAYYQLGKYKEAITEYEYIEKTSKEENVRNQARANKERILGEYSGG